MDTQGANPPVVAVVPDDLWPPGTHQDDRSSPRWTEYLQQRDCLVRTLDVYRPDVLDQLAGCDALMWRHAHVPRNRQVARRLLPVVQHTLGMRVYPDQATCWHYDDKVAQAYLLAAVGIPTPRTWVHFGHASAVKWLETAPMPVVLKLSSGASSSNVRLICDIDEARQWVRTLFGWGVGDLADSHNGHVPRERRLGRRIYLAARMLLIGRTEGPPWELHRGYVLFQEFLPDNAFDTRVTVIGDRAFARRRMNRPDDFRASGSGNTDYDPAHVDMRFVELAFDVAGRLGMQSVSIDGLFKDGQPLVTEISYTCASWGVHNCPGHWRKGPSGLTWTEGAMWPEEAHVTDLLDALHRRRKD